MAEDYGVSLKITADTSDLDKIPQKVEAVSARVAETKAKSEVEVEERREPAAPVEHPAETVEVVEKRVVEPARGGDVPVATERTETVKVHVEQPEPVTVKVSQDPDPLKIKVELPDPSEIAAAIPKKDFHVDVRPQLDPSKLQAIPPIQVPVEAETPPPVTVEAKAEKVRVEVDDEEAKKRIEALTAKEGIKRIRVVTEGGELTTRNDGKEIFELEVDAEKAKKTIADLKADARLKVTADTSAAERSTSAFFASFRRGVAGLRAAISSVFAAFGMVTFVVGGIMALVAGFQKLRDMATATSRAIQQMRFDAWLNGFNAAADAMIGKHQKIIALLKEEQDVANKAASLAKMETSQDRAQEDSARQQVRSVQLAAATDPRERARLEDQFAAEDADIARRRFEEDKKRKLAQLDDEQSIYQSKANGAASQIGNVDREIANQEDIVSRARDTIKNGGEKEKYDKVIEAAKKRIESLKDEKKALEDLQNTAQREADYRGKQIEIVEKSQPSQSSSASQQLAAAKNAALDRQDQRAQRDYTEDRDRRAADAEWDARFRAAQRRASAPDATEAQRNEAENTQLEMLRGKEDAAKAELEAAEKELAEEMAKEAKDRDEDRMARARERAARAQGDQISAASDREALEAQVENRRANVAQDYFGNLARQIDASRPKDRLTAMGLGSGAPGDSRIAAEQANNVKQLVSISKQLLAATRDNRPNNVAVFAP